jgi:SAM-dependent methyltransferase
MIKNLPFNKNVALYDEWFENHPYVFKSELEAIKKMWPTGNRIISLEIGAATGRFSVALGVTESIEPAPNMALVAEARGVHVELAVAEDLPYENEQFDVVLINFCICYLDLPRALTEVFRVLKNDGCLIIGFVDKNSKIGAWYEKKKHVNPFYRQATFYSVPELESLIKAAGFSELNFSQTLFNDLDKTNTVEESIPGYGDGSYVLIKALKKAS